MMPKQEVFIAQVVDWYIDQSSIVFELCQSWLRCRPGMMQCCGWCSCYLWGTTACVAGWDIASSCDFLVADVVLSVAPLPVPA